MEQLTLEKPFTDPDEKYTVLNSNEEYCFEVHNLRSGKTYIVNPFIKICDCKDFEFRTNNGSCKHIDFLQSNDRIKPLLEKYESAHAVSTKTAPIPSSTSHDSEGEQHPFAIMETRDEQQIIDDMRGRVINEYVYDFTTKDGKHVTGLSYAGVKELSSNMGSIHTDEPMILQWDNNGTNGIMAKVRAIDVRKNNARWGTAFQSWKMRLKNGMLVDDIFAVTKAISKAERNAIRKIIPEKIILEMIKEYRKGRGKQ